VLGINRNTLRKKITALKIDPRRIPDSGENAAIAPRPTATVEDEES